MTSLAELNVEKAVETRAAASRAVLQMLSVTPTASEVTLHEAAQRELGELPDCFPEGWYSPPPQGIGVLLADEDDPSRLQYDTLRNKEFWPSDQYVRTMGTVGLIHVSPVDQFSGMIGDFGLTFYQGDNEAIQEHLKESLRAIEAIAGFAAAGMSYAEVFENARSVLKARHLTPDRMTTDHDPSGLNFGHTLPWTTHNPTTLEQYAMDVGDFEMLKENIRRKRFYVAANETSSIPSTGAFTVEARLESVDNPELPLAYFHLLVAMKQGQKEIFANLNPLFDMLSMDYIRSKY